MDYPANVIDFHFHPMVEGIDSTLRINVEVPRLGHSIWLEDSGSIAYLSGKYNFEEVKGGWHFGDFKKRRLWVRDSGNGYVFNGFIQD